MQNLNEKGETLYTERADDSGFTIREIMGTTNEHMRFQAGYIITRPMRNPVFNGNMAIAHKDGDNIQSFMFHGSGSTKEKAITNASNKLIRADIAAGI